MTKGNKKIKSPVAVILGLSTLATSLLTIAYQSQSVAQSSDEGLKIGVLLPTTGDLAPVGKDMPKAAQLAVEKVNACGGVNGLPVTLISEDSQTDPKVSAEVMTKLSQVDKVAGVVGDFASSGSTAAVSIAVKDKVMLISPGSTSPVFTDRAKKGEFQGYWARTAPPDTYQAKALAALVKKKGLNQVSTVVINNDYGVAFEKEFVQAFEKLGGTVVNKDKPVRYDPKATTLDSEAAAALAGNPQGVAAVLYAETGSILIKSAFEQGLTENVTFFLTDGVYSQDFVNQVGATADGKSILAGAVGTVPGADGKALESFTKIWKDGTKMDVVAYSPHTWDATVLLMLAAQASKTNTGEGIKSKIREVAGGPGVEVSDPCEALKLLKEGKDINYQGASGNVDIDANGDVVGSYDVWTVEPKGELKVIDKVSPAE